MASLLTLSDEEDQTQYKLGGYHRVSLGEVYNDKYLVIKKLGYGHFSTVWLVYDLDTRKYWAMKVMRGAAHYASTASDEIEFLSRVADCSHCVGHSRIVRLIDHFKHIGPNGTHVCMVFEVLSISVRKLISMHRRRGMPLPLVKAISQQVLEGLKFLHEVCQIIHTDLKPDNVMVEYSAAEFNAFVTDTVCRFRRIMKNPDQVQFIDVYGSRITDSSVAEVVLPQYDQYIKVKIGDLGNGCYTYHHQTSHIQTRQYRGPEILLGIPYNDSADVWSFACMFYKMVTGHFLFKPREGTGFSKEDHHLALMIQRLGPFPKAWMKTGSKYQTYFRSKARLRRKTPKSFKSVHDVLVERYHFSVRVAEELSAFLAPMLEVMPERRARAADCLNHPWLRRSIADVEQELSALSLHQNS